MIWRRIRRCILQSLAALALALVVLIAVLAINTARFTSRQLSVAPAPQAKIDEAAAIDRLSRALRIETVSPSPPEPIDPAPFDEFHTFLSGEYPLVYSRLERIDLPGHSLLFRWPGEDPAANPILLMGHLDVVPIEPRTKGQWEHPPFSGRIDENGWLWGRGALDVKPAVTGLMEACEHLLAKGEFSPACDIYLAFGHDEELGGAEGAARIAELLRMRLAPSRKLQYVLDEGGAIIDGLIPGLTRPVAYVAVAEKGYITIEISATHAGGHSSTPPGETAVSIVADAVARLHENPFPTRLEGATGMMLDFAGPEMPLGPRVALSNRWLFGPVIRRQFSSTPATSAVIRTTTAATMIDGGVKDNVLPTRATARVNFRILPGETRKTVLARVREIVDHPAIELRVMPMASDPSSVTRADTAEFRLLQRTIGEVFPGVLAAPGLSIGATDSRHFQPLALSTFRFIPLRVSSGDLARIHGVNERIGAANYIEIVRFYIRLIENTASKEAVASR
jgi:carboxypeptidase PM20D1